MTITSAVVSQARPHRSVPCHYCTAYIGATSECSGTARGAGCPLAPAHHTPAPTDSRALYGVHKNDWPLRLQFRVYLMRFPAMAASGLDTSTKIGRTDIFYSSS